MVWSYTAPKEGQGYHKCDFTVQYPDGNYDGRYDLNYDRTTDQPTIEAHIMRFLGSHPQLFAKFFETHDLNGLNP